MDFILPTGSELEISVQTSHTPKITPNYLQCALDSKNLEARVETLRNKLKNIDFEAIAFCGMSGALVAPILAVTMNRSLIMVRKEAEVLGEGCHSKTFVDGDIAARRYVVVDDMIDTGSTVRYIVKKTREWNPDARCVGIALYHPFCINPSYVDDLSVL